MENLTIYTMMKTLIKGKFYIDINEINTILAMYLGMKILSQEQTTELMLFAKNTYDSL